MVSYKPLWHLLVQRDMSKRELMLMVGIAPNTMTKLRRNEEVSMTVLTKICKTLNIYCPLCGLSSEEYFTQDVIDLAIAMTKNKALLKHILLIADSFAVIPKSWMRFEEKNIVYNEYANAYEWLITFLNMYCQGL